MTVDGMPAQRFLRQWRIDPDLAVVREETALAKLPPDERAAWQKLWTEVDAVLKKAASK